MEANQSPYAFDTSSLIQMRKVYPPDVFPSAWAKLDELVEADRVISVENVQQELAGQDDEVFRWARDNAPVFLALTAEIQLQAANILNDYPTLIDPRRPRSNADPFIIAVAVLHRCVLVADEVPSGSPQKHKIPDVCRALGIEHIRVLDVFRRERLRL